MTSVRPSHLPVEKPIDVGGCASGAERPSIQTRRGVLSCMNTIR
jgi:hypothetical protein